MELIELLKTTPAPICGEMVKTHFNTPFHGLMDRYAVRSIHSGKVFDFNLRKGASVYECFAFTVHNCEWFQGHHAEDMEMCINIEEEEKVNV